jgi:maltooligosyltrehalose trehalohydrolase
MIRRHDMPFGAECREDGKVRFRLWAPAARQVDLCLHSGSSFQMIPLAPGGHGWFELHTDAAHAGSQYSFRIDGGQRFPDPASRFQPKDVHGPSEVVDPAEFHWRDENWRGRRWEEAVIYELHVGAFSDAGTFLAVRDRLDYLADLGITVLELMPVSDFPGRRNWGYDGVFPFAPDSTYGRPEDLKELVQSAHAHGIMILLDVVYNHFGPEGNYLRSYAPQFFTDRHRTPWGEGINFDGPDSRPVRDFFIHNALYWLEEYHFDGLRLDAVHAIADDSSPDILTELASTVRHATPPDRQVHLVLENDRNQSHYLQRGERCRPRHYTAQWNDDIHHATHVLITGEHDGYYSDYSDRPLDRLGRCLTEGFAYQGEPSAFRNGLPRGENTAGLPFAAFISFLQNHDQIGNRAFGERIVEIADPAAVRAALEILLLTPSPPMLFMGEEFGAETPFLFFCDFQGELATAVTEGRRNEFARFARFSDPVERERIPDPNAVGTFVSSRLDWDSATNPAHQAWRRFYRGLLETRCLQILPHIRSACRIKADYMLHGEKAITVRWHYSPALTLTANLEGRPVASLPAPGGEIFYASEQVTPAQLQQGILPPWSVVWSSTS